MIKIEDLRNKINSVDDELIRLLNERFELSGQVIDNKIQANLNINDLNRESNILKKLNDIDNSFKIKKIFTEILKFSKFPYLKDAKLDDLLQFRPIIIAGPCTVESKTQIDSTARKLSSLGIRLLRGGTFKPRTNPNDFQGLGAEGIKLLTETAHKYNMYSVTELLDEYQLNQYYDQIDILQIGSRNMTNYAFLKEIGKKTAMDNKPIILKRGFSSTINEFINAAKYISNEGNDNIILALRGIRTFEQIDSEMRNTPDLASIIELKEKTDFPVIFDPSHSTGNSKYVFPVSRAALEIGADGIIIETDNNPDEALVDGFQSIYPDDLKKIFNHL